MFSTKNSKKALWDVDGSKGATPLPAVVTAKEPVNDGDADPLVAVGSISDDERGVEALLFLAALIPTTRYHVCTYQHLCFHRHVSKKHEKVNPWVNVTRYDQIQPTPFTLIIFFSKDS